MDMSAYITKLLRSSPEFRKRRRRMLIAFFLRRVLLGIQFTIILPTAWTYVKSFHVQPWFYGLIVAVYQLSGVLTLPLTGLLFDYFKITKEMVGASNFFEMIGNLIYALPYSQWLLFTGRFISGLGGAFLSVMSREIALITTKEERLAVHARMELGHLMGLFFAPAFAFSVKWVDFKIGNWHVQSTNALGVLCSALWFVYHICTIFMVRNLADELSQGYYDYDKAERVGVKLTEELEQNHLPLERGVDKDIDNKPCFNIGNHQDRKKAMLFSKQYFLFIMSNKLVLETTFILFASLLIWIYIGASDVMITLFAQEDFHWPPVYTTIVYLALGVESVAVFGFIGLFGRHLEDESLLMSGLVFCILSLSTLLLYSLQRKNYPVAVGLFCVAYFLGFIGFAKIEIATKSLLSKMYSQEFQGIIQSSTVATLKIGSSLGPLIGSFFFTYLNFGVSVLLSIFVVAMIWGYFCIKELRGTKETHWQAW